MLKGVIKSALKSALKAVTKNRPKLKKFVRDVKRAKQLTEDIEAMKQKQVKVGILSKDGNVPKKVAARTRDYIEYDVKTLTVTKRKVVKEGKPSPKTLLEVATIHEFGLGKQKERSFLRGYFKEEQAKIIAEAKQLTTQVLSGKIRLNQALKLMGVLAVGGIQARIARSPFEPNAESTIKQKGSNVPLIDTGQLRTAIAYQITKKKAG